MINKLFAKSSVLTAFLLAFFSGINPVSADVSRQHAVTLSPEGGVLLSSVILERESFNAVGVRLDDVMDGLMVNFGRGFEPVEIHDDGFGPEAFIFAAPSNSLQFMLSNPASRKFLTLNATVYYQQETDGFGGPPVLEASNQLLATGPRIIKRSEWGADEELRIKNPDKVSSSGGSSVNPCAEIEEKYASQFTLSSVEKLSPNGQQLVWPVQQAAKLERFSIHHTDSDIRDINGDSLTDYLDYSAMVRAIYTHHTLTRGWGDIGYNYLIDPLGNVYEGRYGGDRSIGAHSLCYNHGTLGIAIIGNYENKPVPEPALQAAIQLIGQKAREYKINIHDVSDYRGKNVAGVFGHKDVRATACPGTMLYAEMGRIRDRAALLSRTFSESTLSASEHAYNAELTGVLNPVSLNPGERKKVTLQFKNTGKETWDENTWMHVALNKREGSRVVPVVEDKVFVASDLQEKLVTPGKTGTFEVEVEAGYTTGHFAYQVSPVVNGRYKISRASQYITLQVNEPRLGYEIVSRELPSGKAFNGQHIVSKVKLKNTGNTVWRNHGPNPVRLGTKQPQDHPSLFNKNGSTRIGDLIQSEVAPGEVGEFNMNLFVPEKRTGLLTEYFAPVMEGVSWMEDKGLQFTVNITKPVHRAKTVKAERISSMYPGERRFVEVEMTNLGDLPWDASTVQTTLLGRGIKVFKRMLLPTESVYPGEKTRIGFWIEAPMTPGRHSVYLRSRFNGQPIRGAVANYIILVRTPDLNDKSPREPEVTGHTANVNSAEPVSASLPKASIIEAVATSQTTEKPFRVLLSHDASTATLTANTPFLVLNESSQSLFNYSAGTQVNVRQVSNGFEIKAGDLIKKASVVRLVPKDAAGVSEIVSMVRRPAWDTSGKLNDNRFRGTIEMRIVDGKVAYINELPLEDYMKGLAEVSNGDPAEKQKTIAILARTYARFYMDENNRKFPGKPYDGSDDPNIFQKYLGYGVELRSPNFVKAAEATRDMVVTYGGKLVKTPYFNQSDGRTRSAQEVWNWTTTPYLKSVADPWSEGLELRGHGVGLSGYGATKQAEAGKKAEEIIKYYYNGVEIEKIN